MAVVLVQRVLETVFLAEQALRPLGAFRVAENPASHVLGLNDEDAVFRDDDVVDLGGSVSGLQRDVVQREINLRVEQQLLGNRAEGFADPALDE